MEGPVTLTTKQWLVVAGGALGALWLTRKPRHAPVEGAREMLSRMPPKWWDDPLPRNRKQPCYRRKTDALNVFRDRNWAVIERSGGIDYGHGEEEFDALNLKHDLLDGPNQIRTIAQALWVSIPPVRPFCLADIDVDGLNATTPGLMHPTGFQLPDHIEEQIAKGKEAAYYKELIDRESSLPDPDDPDDVPF